MPARPTTPGAAATRSPPQRDLQQVAALVDALGMAWTSFRLYRDPRSLEPYQRAVATLGTAPEFPWLVEVRRDGFLWSREPVPARRAAVGHLARSAFTRGIGALGFTSPPGPDDLLALLEVIAQARDDAGPLHALADSGAAGVLLVEHGTLIEGQSEHTDEGYIVVEHGAYRVGPSPHEPGESSGEDDVERFLNRYLWEYGQFHERMESEDLLRHGEMMRDCIDSLASLSRADQVQLLAQLLDRHDDPAFRTLLDQLADDDLARLAEGLDARAHPLLREYLRIASDQGSRSRHLLRRILEGNGSVGHLAERIERLLGGQQNGASGSAAARLAAQKPDGARHRRAGVNTLHALLSTPNDDRFRRLIPAWSQKVAAALAEDDLPAAEAWLGAMTGNSLAPDRVELVRAEVGGMVRAGLLDRLVSEPDGSRTGGAALLAALAPLALDPLIDQLGLEPEKARRRALVEVIAAAARADPAPLLRRLTDQRWYLIRNLVLALGRSRRPEAAAALLPLCSHSDHRVRSETLRALRALDPELAGEAALAALDDPHQAVRLLAQTLLRAGDDPRIEEALARRLASGPSAEEGGGIVGVLAGRGSARARSLLAALASRRLVLSPAKRAIRAAARRALRRSER